MATIGVFPQLHHMHVWTTVSSPLSGHIQRSQIHAGQVTEAIMFVHMHTSVGAQG